MYCVVRLECRDIIILFCVYTGIVSVFVAKRDRSNALLATRKVHLNCIRIYLLFIVHNLFICEIIIKEINKVHLRNIYIYLYNDNF